MQHNRPYLQPILEEIERFGEEVKKFRNGFWNEDEFISFRTMHGVYGQRQADAHMVRIKLPLGIVTSEMMRAVAEIAENFSETQIVHITTRQDFQIHFVRLEDASTIMRILCDAGMTTREACGNTVRNVTCSPLAGVCPHEPFDVTPYALEFARFFLRNPLSQHLPRKFKVCFSCCEADDAISAIHDLGFIPQVLKNGDKSEYGFSINVGGGTGASPREAVSLFNFVPLDKYLAYAVAIVKVFNQCDELRKNRARARLKFHVHRVGVEEFRKEVEKELLTTVPSSMLVNQEYTSYLEDSASALNAYMSPHIERWAKKAIIPQKQHGYFVLMVRIPMGNLTPYQLRQLADLMDIYPLVECRTTQQQNLLFRWVKENTIEEFYKVLSKIGLAEVLNNITDITSCPGTNSCKLGITSSMELAKVLSTELSEYGNDTAFRDIHIKVSGCPNGCGHHHVASIGLEGAATKRGHLTVPCYHLLVGGSYSGDSRLGGSKTTRFARRLRVRIPAKRIPDAIKKILEAYRLDRLADESFCDFVDRVGTEYFERLLADLSVIPDLSPSTLPIFIDWGRQNLFKVERGEGECER